MKKERALSKLLDELAAHFDARAPWVFITKERDGSLAVMSNQRSEQIRVLAKSCFTQKRKQEAP